MTDEESRARIDSQASDEQRRAVADHVVSNDGSPQQLADAIRQLWSDAGLS